MSAFYDRMQATALRLIAKFGQQVTLTDVVPGVYDPATGETSAGSTTVQTPMAILQDSGAQYGNGDMIEIGDKKILIAAKGLTIPPRLTSTVTGVDGVVWRIVNVKATNPAGTPLVYEVQGQK